MPVYIIPRTEHYKVFQLLLITNFREVERCLRRVQHLLILSILAKSFFLKATWSTQMKKMLLGCFFLIVWFYFLFLLNIIKSKQKEEGRSILTVEYQPVPDKKWYRLPNEKAARIILNSLEGCCSAFDPNQTVGWGAATVVKEGFLGSQARKQQKWNKAYW